jgi:hypothetical protein
MAEDTIQTWIFEKKGDEEIKKKSLVEVLQEFADAFVVKSETSLSMGFGHSYYVLRNLPFQIGKPVLYEVDLFPIEGTNKRDTYVLKLVRKSQEVLGDLDAGH